MQDDVMDAPGRIEPAGRIYHGPGAYALADWRLRTAALYHAVRSAAEPGKGWRYWRDTRRAMFRAHPMSPIAPGVRAGNDGPNVYAYDPALRFAVDLAPADGPLESVDLGPDGILERRPLAVTIGLAEALSAELTLYWIGGYGGGVFLPFRDATNGSETYGGGRYLIDAIKGADLGLDVRGRLILDFNFAYHPSCTHDVAYVCPLAPAENALPVPVRAGERL